MDNKRTQNKENTSVVHVWLDMITVLQKIASSSGPEEFLLGVAPVLESPLLVICTLL